MSVKRIAILGSTGSIGINTLKVVDHFPDQFKVEALSAYNNFKLLEKQIRKYQPRCVAVGDEGYAYLRKQFDVKKVKIYNVPKDLSLLASLTAVDIVVIGMRGFGALDPFLSAVRCGKTVAPANKEALVVAGEIIMREARKYKATIIPVDSEQSAIFQCLEGNGHNAVRRIHLTASGGALHHVPQSRFDRLSVAQILSHPRWKMGPKITVDSATLMNKGFEVIEAQRLFGLKAQQIEVVIHPQALIHSMVEFCDGSILAQLGITDMRLPIQYALTYPRRLDTGLERLDFLKIKALTFARPDLKKFPALQLAFHVARVGGTLPCVLNAADEEAVEAFLKGKIKFSQIYKVVEKIVVNHKIVRTPTIKEIRAVDQWARQEARKIMGD